MARTLACLLCILTLSLCALADAGAARGADPGQLADRMLAALGGRAAWAGLTSIVNDSQQNRIADPAVVRAVITMDLTRPRFRVETTAPGLHVVRVVDGERHWRKTREGTIEPIPADVLADDRRWHAGHVYRTIHRIAARDGALTLAEGRNGRLEVLAGGARIAWFALDVRGEPYAYGAHDDETGSISGPWDFVADGVRHPIWVSRPDGTWRANLKSLRLNVPLTDAMFAQPDSAR